MNKSIERYDPMTSTLPPPTTSRRDSRARLLQAALLLFAQQGYDSVSTREIALKAGVALASIPYHFRGKRGLYEAVVDNLIERIRLVTAPTLNQINATLDSCGTNRVRLSRSLDTLVPSLLQGLVSVSANWPVFLIHREFVEASDAFERMRTGFVVPHQRVFLRLVSACTGLTPTSLEAAILATAVQDILFLDTTYRIALSAWLQAPPETLVAQLAPPVTRVLRSLLRLPDTRAGSSKPHSPTRR